MYIYRYYIIRVDSAAATVVAECQGPDEDSLSAGSVVEMDPPQPRRSSRRAASRAIMDIAISESKGEEVDELLADPDI